jgi:hypothetical protein
MTLHIFHLCPWIILTFLPVTPLLIDRITTHRTGTGIILIIKVNSAALGTITLSPRMVDLTEVVTLAVVIGATSQTKGPTGDFPALAPIIINLDIRSVTQRGILIICNGPLRGLEVVEDNITLTRRIAMAHRPPIDHVPPMTLNPLGEAKMGIMSDLPTEITMMIIRHSPHRKARMPHPCNHQLMSPIPRLRTKAGSSVLLSNPRLHLHPRRNLYLILLRGCKFASRPLVHPSHHSLAIG